MRKKILFIVLFIIISTSTFAKTFDERTREAKDLYNKKNYEKAKSILLPLITDLEKPNIKIHNRILLYNNLEKISAILGYERDEVKGELFLRKSIISLLKIVLDPIEIKSVSSISTSFNI